MVKNTLKYVHNAMKTPFFHFTLKFRRLIAHRWRHFLHMYVILLLNFHQLQNLTDLWSASLSFSLFNSDPFKPKLTNYIHNNFGALSLRRLAALSSPTPLRHNLQWPRWVKKPQVIDSGGELSCYGPKLCLMKNVANIKQCDSPCCPFLSPRLLLLRLSGTPGTVLSTLVTLAILMKQSRQLLFQMALWTWARENRMIMVLWKESSNTAPGSRLWGCLNRCGR